MNTPIRNVRVVAAGLDLLHSTRLKLACSLLLADRIDVSLLTWSDADAEMRGDLLVTGQDAASTIAIGRWAGPVLAVRRVASPSNPAELAHGATVRDIHERLRQLLSAELVEPAIATPAQHDVRPLPLRMLQAARVPELLMQGHLRMAIDPRNACVHVAADLPLDALIAAFAEPGWTNQPLPQPLTTIGATLPRRVSLEHLYFAIAHRHPEWLPAAAAGQPLQLRQWPDLSEEAASAALLVAIAYLHARPWQAAALAASCQLPLQAVQGLFAAATASGLAQVDAVALPREERRPQRSASTSRFLSWVGRRFGLNLGQAGA